MAMEVMAKIRRFAIGKAGLSPIVVRATGVESLAVAQVESDGQEMTRAGRRFMLGRSAGVTGIPPATAFVQTAQWSIYNGDAQKSYVLDHIGAVLVSGTAAVGFTVMAGIILTSSTAGWNTGSNTAGMSVQNCSNGGPNSKAIVRSGLLLITTPAAASTQWATVANCDSANTSVLAVSAINYDLRGQLIIPPGQALAMNVYNGTGTSPLFAPTASWTEIELDLE